MLELGRNDGAAPARRAAESKALADDQRAAPARRAAESKALADDQHALTVPSTAHVWVDGSAPPVVDTVGQLGAALRQQQAMAEAAAAAASARGRPPSWLRLLPSRLQRRGTVQLVDSGLRVEHCQGTEPLPPSRATSKSYPPRCIVAIVVGLWSLALGALVAMVAVGGLVRQLGPPPTPPAPPSHPAHPPPDQPAPSEAPADAQAAAWQTLWDGPCSDPCGRGTRALQVRCVEDFVEVGEEHCASPAPEGVAPCAVTCLHVDPAEGNDGHAGTLERPLRTVAACTARGVDLGAELLPAASPMAAHQLRCLLRAGVYREEAGRPLAGADHIQIEPLGDGAVIIDGTDEVDLTFSPHAAHGAAVLVSSPLPPGTTRPKLVVGGAALQCANESAVIDGTHLPKRGWATHGVPCFLWDTEAAWSEPFAAEDAVRFFERGEAKDAAWRVERRVPKIWFSEASRVVYFRSDGEPPPLVQVKNESRADLLDVGAGANRVFVRGLHFYGAACCGAGPVTMHNSHDLRLERNRFLYAPVSGVRLTTTARNGRGAGSFARIQGNCFEFGEAGLRYKSTGAEVLHNYWAFNSFEARGEYTVDAHAMRSLFLRNTLLYNGDKGGHFNWARGNRLLENLIIGQNFLGPRFDAAVFHAVTLGQEGLMVEGNWALGPSLVSFIRLDTSQTTSRGAAGRHAVVRNNVHFGLGITLKGYNHTAEHNVGSKLLVVSAWAAIDDHNAASIVRYNAHSKTSARASSRLHGAIPGLSSLNVCNDLLVCNPNNSTRSLTPAWLAAQFTNDTRRLDGGVSRELVGGSWAARGAIDTSGIDGGGAAENEAGVADGDTLLGGRKPWEISTPVATGMDFRPRRDGRLVLDCSGHEAACAGDGRTVGYTTERPVYTSFDSFVGAYAPDAEVVPPGCPACAPGGGYSIHFPIGQVL